MEWYEHMEEEKIANNVTGWEVAGRSCRGIHVMKWFNCVQETKQRLDLQPEDAELDRR